MAGKVNTFKVVMIIAGCLCVVAMSLQIAGISIDYIQSITSANGTIRYWGLWNYCYRTPYVIRNITYHDIKCYSLVNSDENIIRIHSFPSSWKLFQAANVVSLLLLVAVFLLIVTQLCCLKYNKRSIVAAVTLSTIAGLLILIGCIAYAGIKNSYTSDSNNGQLEYSFYLLVAAGVMAIISAMILNVARRKFPKDRARPSSSSVTPTRPLGTDQNTTSLNKVKSKNFLYQIYAKMHHSRSKVNSFPSRSMPPRPPSKLGMHIEKSLGTPLAIESIGPHHAINKG